MATRERPYHHGNLRRALLDAALRMFAERGSFDFSLRELAREAGVTHGAPYRHFDGKGALLGALQAEGFALLTEACRAAVAAAEPDARSEVRALGEAYVRFAVAHPHHFRLMLHNPLGEGAPPEASGQSFALLRQALERGQRAGVVRSDRSGRELALAAWAVVHGLSSLLVAEHLAGGETRLRRYALLLEETLFEGLMPR